MSETQEEQRRMRFAVRGMTVAGYIAGFVAGFGIASFAFLNPYISLAVTLCGLFVYPMTIWKATQNWPDA